MKKAREHGFSWIVQTLAGVSGERVFGQLLDSSTSRRFHLLQFAIVISAALIALAPGISSAQSPQKTYRVAHLSTAGRTPDGAPPRALRESLQQLGYLDGHNVSLANPDDQNMSFQVAELRGAAGKRGIELRIFEARNAAQLDTALEQMVAWKSQAVFPLPNPMRYSERLIQWAAQHRVPVMYANNADTLAGGLMAYDADLSDHYQRVGIYVDKLLAGTDPATLPVERPARFELTLNLKTARALGLKFPQSLLSRADGVIE